jgi:phosphopantetheine adenylyltransferase
MWKQKPRSAKEIGLTRSESLQKRVERKKKKVQRCVTRKKKVQRCVTRKKEIVQRYMTTQNISDPL